MDRNSPLVKGAQETQPEAWLRGPVPGVDPAIGALIHSFQQAREDLARFTEGLSDQQIWMRPYGLAPLGFQLRHIAGSVERLTVYLSGGVLSETQLAAMRSEMEPGGAPAELLAAIDASFARTEAVVRQIDPSALTEPRGIGRKQLPTTVGGLVIHMAEHTTRHVGEAIVTAKVLRALAASG
ncbi:MAG TPA: DinB family protein [Bryobacteraceae bacterium]|nr:DinB family protein [Bryobacteraceae bacterium]